MKATTHHGKRRTEPGIATINTYMIPKTTPQLRNTSHGARRSCSLRQVLHNTTFTEIFSFPLPPGVHPAATHRPGRWLGKGIRAGSSEGYNLFAKAAKPVISSSSGEAGGSGGESEAEVGLPGDTRRERLFRFSQASDSVFDRGVSSRLDYAKAGKNGPLFGGMRDEVRLHGV